MKAVGVKILKAKLSEYLRLVKNGEVIWVTDRDEVVAELRPAHRQPLGTHNFENVLEKLADQHYAKRASESPKQWQGFTTKLTLEGMTSQEMLDLLREDSR